MKKEIKGDDLFGYIVYKHVKDPRKKRKKKKKQKGTRGFYVLLIFGIR